jgi:hypothetical protein
MSENENIGEKNETHLFPCYLATILKDIRVRKLLNLNWPYETIVNVSEKDNT